MIIINYVMLGILLFLLSGAIVVLISYRKHQRAVDAWKLVGESPLPSGELDRFLVNSAAMASADAAAFDRWFRFVWRMTP